MNCTVVTGLVLDPAVESELAIEPQLAPEGTFMSVHAAGTQYEEAEKTQYGSPMAAWRSPVVTLYLAESASHPVPLVGMVMPFRSAAQIV